MRQKNPTRPKYRVWILVVFSIEYIDMSVVFRDGEKAFVRPFAKASIIIWRYMMVRILGKKRTKKKLLLSECKNYSLVIVV